MKSADDRKNDQESFGGARKLIRPLLSAVARRRALAATPDPLTHALVTDTQREPASSHAEAFYFQKQIQQGTEMTVILDDGEELRGTIEWYDRVAIKLRSGRHRVLIYKAAIKYLYKSSDAHQPGTVMR